MFSMDFAVYAPFPLKSGFVFLKSGLVFLKSGLVLLKCGKSILVDPRSKISWGSWPRNLESMDPDPRSKISQEESLGILDLGSGSKKSFLEILDLGSKHYRPEVFKSRLSDLRFSSLVLVSLVLAYLEFYVELTWRSWHSDPICCSGTAFVVASFVARSCFPSFVTSTSMAILAAGSATPQDDQAVVVLSVTPGQQPQPTQGLRTGSLPGRCPSTNQGSLYNGSTWLPWCATFKEGYDSACRGAGGMEPGSFQEIPSQPHPAESGTHTKAATAACSAGTTCILAGKTSDVESVRC